VKTPWLLREVEWTARLVERAVIWLAGERRTPILKLSSSDYREHHLSSLLARFPSVDVLNKAVFSRLAQKICDNPRLPRERRVIVFSPHPDDDVISMGGTLRKLHENDNDLVVAYMTSGNIAVFDHEVRRYLDFMHRFQREILSLVGKAFDTVASAASGRRSRARGRARSTFRRCRTIKRQIREAEAVSGVEALGIPASACRFLNLPFYQTGQGSQGAGRPADVRSFGSCSRSTRPEVIYVAGDLSDPHGTHRQCKEAIELALDAYDGLAARGLALPRRVAGVARA
jgi:glucosamine-6-phosphate deaminase